MTNLAFCSLYQLDYFISQVIVLRSSVSEHIYIGAWEGHLQGFLNSTNRHFRTISTSLANKGLGELSAACDAKGRECRAIFTSLPNKTIRKPIGSTAAFGMK